MCDSESCPTCRVPETHPDHVKIECSVRLNGNWSPSLLIYLTGPPTVRASVTLVSEDSEEHVNLSRTLDYHASFTVSTLSFYTTKLVFDDERRPTADSATNIPSSNCTRNSSDSDVHVDGKLRSSFIVITHPEESCGSNVMGLRWRYMTVYSWASPLLSVFRHCACAVSRDL